MAINIPPDLQYTREHEWIYLEGEDVVVIGITDFAQDQLEDIVYLELPEVGTPVLVNEPFGTIEAVKAVEDLFAPVTGEIVDVNHLLEEKPELCNLDPYGDGWIVKIKFSDKSEFDNMISAKDYSALIE